MQKSSTHPSAQAVILTLAEIQAAVEAFNRGDANAFAAMEAIAGAVEAYLTVGQPRSDAA